MATFKANSNKPITTPENAFEHFVQGFISERQYTAIRDAEKFVVGARVIAVQNYEDARIKGLRGTITRVRDTRGAISVEFDEAFKGGHTASGTGKDGHCWNLNTKYVRILDESEVG